MLFTEPKAPAPDGVPQADKPLAARLRPRSFADYVGQSHIIGPGQLLRRAIEADRFTAIILYGPPGVGKTTMAELIAAHTAAHFERLSAVTGTVADVRTVIKEADARRRLESGRRTVLFIDEIHRFNRAQQDVLLPVVENGVLRLVGCTTENPFFCVNGPLVSRAQVFRLEALGRDDIATLLGRAVTAEAGLAHLNLRLTDEAISFWAERCEGDGRRALTALEVAALSTPADADGLITVDLTVAEQSLQEKAVSYGDDGHYDTASAFIKSMRGNDANAAIYWLAKMLHAGEDIRFIARRVVIFAAEDVGNADPRALELATTAMQAVQMIGMPEARIILSQAVAYVATAPKSNAAIMAIDQALADVRSDRVQPVPVHLRDGHYAGSKRLGHGVDYQYSHNAKDGVADQDYLEIPAVYYEPKDIGYEARIRERMAFWEKRRRELRGEPNGPGRDSTGGAR